MRKWASRLQKKLYFQLDQKVYPFDHLSPLNSIAMIMILLSIGVQIIETEHALYDEYRMLFDWIDWGFAVFFTIELLARIWSYGHNKEYAGIWGRIRYLTTPRALVDVMTLVPFYISAGSADFLWLRLFRVMRLLSLVKFKKLRRTLKILFGSIKERRFELLVTFFLALLMLVISAALLYLIERNIQPEAFGSIPRALWWSVATLTTVGYGDVYPVTALGRVVAGSAAICGVGLVAMPTGILAAAFSDAFQKNRKKAMAD